MSTFLPFGFIRGTPPHSGVWETITYAGNGGWGATRVLCWNVAMTSAWYWSDASALPPAPSHDQNTSGAFVRGDNHVAYRKCFADLSAPTVEVTIGTDKRRPIVVRAPGIEEASFTSLKRVYDTFCAPDAPIRLADGNGAVLMARLEALGFTPA